MENIKDYIDDNINRSIIKSLSDDINHNLWDIMEREMWGRILNYIFDIDKDTEENITNGKY